jgi:hypothetical protein
MANPIKTACSAAGDDIYSYSIARHPEEDGRIPCPKCRSYVKLRADAKGKRRIIPWHLETPKGRGSLIIPKDSAA